MSKPPPQRDPMAGVVDRLLAQLPGLQGQPAASRASSFRPATPSVVTATPLRISLPDQDPSHTLGVWARVLLALGFGTMMASWPYSTACGLPLLGYGSALVTLILAGASAASSAWKYRSGLAHVIALVLVLYGIALGAAELLPRTGYAARHATWVCDESI